MSSSSRLIERCVSLWQLLCGRTRGSLLKLRGAKGGEKLTIASNCHIDRPWLIEFGKRVKLEQNVYLKVESEEAEVTIGAYSFLGAGVQFDVLESVSVGAHVLIAPGAFLVDHNHGTDARLRIDQQTCKSDAIEIRDDVWIGAKAVILPGVRIGRGAIVAAGAVVRQNVEPMTIVAGVPAKPIGLRKESSSSENLMRPR